MHNLMQSFGRMYQVNIPSATFEGKTGATSLARNVSGPTATLVQNQMAHSPKTHARFYRAITGAKDAAAAFCSMEKLRQQEKPDLLMIVKKPPSRPQKAASRANSWAHKSMEGHPSQGEDENESGEAGCVELTGAHIRRG